MKNDNADKVLKTQEAKGIKNNPDDINEIHPIKGFKDNNHNVITPLIRLDSSVAQAVIDAFKAVVRNAEKSKQATTQDEDGIIRFQEFEEGDVYMAEKPYDGYFADRYIMDFYNIEERGICSRMHFHTGMRFVRMMTGNDTVIRVGSLVPFEQTNIEGVTPFQLDTFEDILPDAEGNITRYNAIVPPNSFVDMQVPTGVSHQFNAIGKNAVIDSVHPEESVEVFREKMSGFKMLAQTIFLTEGRPSKESCEI